VKEFKVIIAGGRDFDDYKLLKESLDFLFQNKENIVIISGKARGADSLGEKYAKEKTLRVEEFPAEWDKYGKSAGYRRNEQMAQNADALVAFWDGVSRGTKHMIDIAKSKKLKIRIVEY
jgi:hypothetical protein